MKLRTQALDYGTNAASDESGIKCEDKSLAIQSAKDDADINIIVRRMGLGQAAPVTARMPMQGDFDEIFDYRTALERVQSAERAFMQLPPQLRAQLENDPANLLPFIQDPRNAKELVRLGLAVPRPQEAPKEAEKPKDAPK